MRGRIFGVVLIVGLCVLGLGLNAHTWAQGTAPRQSLPDLAIGALYLTQPPGTVCDDGTSAGVAVEVLNVGDAAAGPFLVEVNGVRQNVAEGLQAGGSTLLWFPGFRSIDDNQIIIDPTAQVAESDETNNSRLAELLPPTPRVACTPAPTIPVPTKRPWIYLPFVLKD